MKKALKLILTVLMILAIALTAISCGASDSDANLDGRDRVPNGALGTENSGSSGSSDGKENGGEELLEDRKIIKNVHESVQTDNYEEFLRALDTAVASADGYFQTMEERGDSYYHNGSLRYLSAVIRIPAENLAELTAAIDGAAVVTSYRESVDDVTTAYIDVESRIAVLKAEETALIAMLTEATSVDISLKIRERLLEVQSDLASLEKQKESYDDKISYSTVYLNVNEVRRATVENPTFIEEVKGEFSDTVYEIGEGFRSFGIWLLGDSIYILIWCGVITGAFFLLRFLLKRHTALRSKRKEQKSSIDSEKSDGTDSPS